MTDYCLKFLHASYLRSVNLGLEFLWIILKLIVIDDVLRFVTLTGISNALLK